MSAEIISFILKYDSIIRFFHIAGAVIAITAVCFSDLMALWMKLKPKKAELVSRISPWFSLAVWSGLFLISISGILMLFPRQGLENYNIFQLKMILVLVIFLNGIFLNTYVTPKFQRLVPKWQNKSPEVSKFIRVAGISAAISFICWWIVVILMAFYY